MKNIRYAIASVFYHRKNTFYLTLCAAFFLILSTSLLNLMHMEKNLYIQLSSLVSINWYTSNFLKNSHSYMLLYIVLLMFALVIFTSLICRSILLKEADILRWRIMGFSNRFILFQFILETLVPLILGIALSSLVLLLFQHTYDFLLMKSRSLIANDLGLQHLSFSSLNTLTKSAPESMPTTANEGTYFLSFDLTSLSLNDVFNAFLKNSGLLLLTSFLTTAIFTYFLLIKSKQTFRM